MIKRLSPTAIGRWSTRRPSRDRRLDGVRRGRRSCPVADGVQVAPERRGGQSARGYALMNSHQLGLPQDEYAYLQSGALTTDDSGFRVAISQVAAYMHGALGGPVYVTVAHDRHAALVTVAPTRQADFATLDASVAAVGKAHPGVTALVADATSNTGNDLQRAEQLSIPVTLIVLLIAFGALMAALVPVMLAATAVIAAFGLLGPISHVFPLDNSVKTVVLLIGMAVGVDYALFYVVRSREERLRGISTREALEPQSRTSGRSVLIAGTTVGIAMAGQFVVGSDIFNGIAAGTIVVVGCAVAGSLTVLPALLQLLGPRVDRGRHPLPAAARDRRRIAFLDRAGRPRPPPP